MTTIPIGIDLGTTTSSVAIVLEGKVEVVQNEQGCRTTPSCVAFKDREPLIGTVALDQMDSNMHNTISGMKRMLGRQFRDISDSSHACQWSSGDDTLPKVDVQWPPEENKLFSPEEITALLISKLMENVDTHLTSGVEGAPQHCYNVVIAVPACFNSSQRQATKDAAVIAGIPENCLIDEPIAAALTYGFQHKGRYGPCNLLIVDIGGGKCEVGIVKIDGNEWGTDETYVLKGTAGNDHFGGNDFDKILVEHCTEQYKEFLLDNHEHLSEDLSDDALQNLRTTCQSIKHKLTLLHSTTVDVYLDGMDFPCDITRKTFENLCSDYFTAIGALVNGAMGAAKLDPTEINDYILIGGSTRIPKIRTVLKEVFAGKEPIKTINPDEAVAFGTAIYAEFLSRGRRAHVDSGTTTALHIEAVNGHISSENPNEPHVIAPRRLSSFHDVPRFDVKEKRQWWETMTIVKNFTAALNYGHFRQYIRDMHTIICSWHEEERLVNAADYDRFLTASYNFNKYYPFSGVIKDRFLEICSIFQRMEETMAKKRLQNETLQQETTWTTGFPNKMCLYTISNLDTEMTIKVFDSSVKHLVMECGIIGTTKLEFNIDEDGILDVSADDTYGSPLIVCRAGCLNKVEITAMAHDWKLEKLRNAAKRSLEMYVYDIGDQIKDFYSAGTLTDHHQLLFSTFREAKRIISPKSFLATHEYRKTEADLEQLYDLVVALEAECKRCETPSRESSIDTEEEICSNDETDGGIIN